MQDESTRGANPLATAATREEPTVSTVTGEPAVASVVGEPAAAAMRGSLGELHRATLLLRTVIELSDAFERALGKELGVNPTDLTAMEHLIQSGPLTPSEIAKRLSLTPAAATTVVDRLASVGHVTRSPHPTDRRGVLVLSLIHI